MSSPATSRSALPPAGGLLDGRWLVLDVLEGAMGTVLLLQDPASGARLAAKTPLLADGLSSDVRQRFAVEARTWLTLGHHPNVVEALFFEDIVIDGVKRPFLFLEFVAGPTLTAVLETERELAVPVVLDLATGIARGMAYAHGEGRPGARIVHRDLKPENVFVTRDRVAKVSDFGIARALDRPTDVVGEGLGAGTPFYAAPEQLKDARTADRRSDLYSFGALVFELLTGRPPFRGPGLSDLVMQILRAPVPSLRAACPAAPPELEEIVTACLAKSPSGRPSGFDEVLLRISEIREQDDLWLPVHARGSCPGCGWMTLTGGTECTLCGDRMGPPMRYAPVSPRAAEASVTLGRSEGTGEVRVAGVEVRPRVPRAGDEVVITVLLENPGADPVEGVAVPFTLPDRDAFRRVRESQRAFIGTVPPTAAGAPIRVSWPVVPLRPGEFELRAPGALYRTLDGRRRVARGANVELHVRPAVTDIVVGRQEERDALEADLARVAQGGAALAALLGPPGFGKTLLTRHAWDAAAELDFQRARGRCLGRGVEVRGALKEAARQALGLSSRQMSPGPIAAAVVEALGGGAPAHDSVVRFIVDELLMRPVARGESPAGMWAQFFAELARERPLLLAIEDVQRDPEVGDICLHIVRHADRAHARVMVVLSGRLGGGSTGLTNRLYEAAEQDPGVQMLLLEPLTSVDTEEFLQRQFAPNDFASSAPWLPRAVWRLTGGNPLLLRELIHALKSVRGPGSGLLVTQDGLWTAGPELTEERLRESLPSELDDVLLARFSEFDERTRAFLRAAAVLGDVFELDLLRELLDDPEGFDASLSELERAMILRERPGSPPRARFHEPLIPELLDRSLAAADPDEHKRLHGRAADLLADLPGASRRNALRLGRHLAAAGRTDEALMSLLDAVQRLVDRQAYGRARTLLDDVLGLLDRGARVGPRRMTRLRVLQGEVLRFTGDLRGALRAYESVLGHVQGSHAASGRLATVYSKKGKVHEALGELDEALYCFAVGLSLREEAGLERDVPMSLANLGGLHFLRGDYARAEEYLKRALTAAARVENARGLSVARVVSARLHLHRGDTSAARRDLRLALRAARDSRNKRATAEAWRVLGRIALREGRLRSARHLLQRALRVHQEVGDRMGAAEVRLDVAAVLEVAGDDEAALVAIGRVVDDARSLQLDRLESSALLARGRLELTAGRPRNAQATLREALTIREFGEDVPGRAECRALLATAERLVGERARVEELLDTAWHEASSAMDVDAQALVLISRADALAAWGDRDGALEAVRAARAVGGLASDHALALDIRAAELTDDLDAARAAAEAAGRSTNARALARSLASLGFVALRRGAAEEATTALRRAAALLRQRGARDPLLLAVLRASARAQAEADPAAAEAASRRAAELEAVMVGEGYAPGVCRGFEA